ncbi:hypothetical protein PBI_LAUER_57 [Gordonia phage Lauer]|uniref:Uncharacterized protein n=2 Tax=Ponsvirus TaxID=3044795 RepID=A0A515MIK0_9CAUD|nr:hypothetical protein PP995_gp57 [Gordonia phage Lauer]YP_010663339.1 hypothetical protein PP996_gp66 [Gordonia phage SheckWes]QDM56492.1 hypothetical protein SEA_SHECKWES_66 [Gordonia phage SheckWes]QGJ92164.1 hypothetical protein PBI_LAUER_57 [Gordonia phage Lauer]
MSKKIDRSMEIRKMILGYCKENSGRQISARELYEHMVNDQNVTKGELRRERSVLGLIGTRRSDGSYWYDNPFKSDGKVKGEAYEARPSTRLLTSTFEKLAQTMSWEDFKTEVKEAMIATKPQFK